MTRLLGPAPDGRLVYYPSGGFLHSAAGMSAVVYAASSGGTLADILTYNGTETPGAAVAGSTLTIDSDSQLPQVWFPDGVDTIWVSVNGGTRTAVYADADRRADTLSADVAALTATVATKAPIASPTFTGTVGGITKAMVGLGSVDNTADSAKPVSTAQATALALKVDKGAQVINIGDYATGNGSTDDTATINTALAAAGPGSTVWFPKPASYWRITGPLTPPSGVTVVGAGNGCEIRQATQGQPVFDLLGRDDVTVRGFTLANGAGVPATIGGTFRADNAYAYNAGVWANGHRIVVEDLRIKDFVAGVYFSSYDGVSALSATRRVGNIARNLDVSGANFSVLYVCQENLRIEGLYAHDNVDTSAGANPVHGVYGTGTATLRSKNVTVTGCQAKNVHASLAGSAAWQFKYVDGLVLGDLLADSCYGLANFIDGTDIVGSNLVSVNTSADQSTGALYMATVATNPTRVNLSDISIQMATADARVINVIADDARLSNIRVTVNRSAGSPSSYDTILRGNRIAMNGYKSRNVGAANGNAITVGSASVATSDVTITNPELDGSVQIVDFDQTCTGVNVIEYMPAMQRRMSNAASAWVRAVTGGSLGGAVTYSAIRRGVASVFSPYVGEFAPPRERVTSGTVAATSQTMVLTYFQAERTETITTVKVATGSTAAAATPSLCRLGIYSVAENGDITLVASTANDTSLFAATNTEYAVNLSSSWSKLAGRWYAHAVLIVSATTTPNWHGIQYPGTNPMNTFSRVAPPFGGRVLSQTDLPSSVVAGSIVGYQGVIAMHMY